ncbi:uncharacterized protein LOC118851391 [Trichosurus vulpecula]|uniref:uncharacterized protein LOC118851391 n=1 Tax=Trichosurus vulpecula TaxID=9337 RepID=UPI00186B0F94|nr:uncharacterized protein LOC118851391 [Trichosurus vulpecula]
MRAPPRIPGYLDGHGNSHQGVPSSLYFARCLPGLLGRRAREESEAGQGRGGGGSPVPKSCLRALRVPRAAADNKPHFRVTLRPDPPFLVLLSPGQRSLCSPPRGGGSGREEMSQARALSRRWLPPSHGQEVMTAAAPEADPHSGPPASRLSGAAEQTEFNTSAAIQVGHQLAVIGDEFNRMYCGKAQDTAPHAAPALAPVWSPTFSFVQTGALSIFRSFTKCFPEPVGSSSSSSSSWMRGHVAWGNWVPVLPASTVYWKVIPVALLLILFGLVVHYGLPN